MREAALTSPELGDFQFRFAVLADTHINPTDGESPSPWLTNRHANARSRAVVQEINRYEPAFTVHLGDIVHPVPSQPTYSDAAVQARSVLDRLDSPLHCVPGNHDMGDKYVEWAPAVVVNEPFLDVYESHFGKDFYAFEHKGCRFVVLNSQVFNSGLAREADQWSWLEAELAANGASRTFLFSHYPPYVADPREIEHYDNMGEPARGRLLRLVERHGVTAVFAGHVHNYFYDRLGDCDLYVLPAVSAVRHDYSELFATPPTDDDHGRDDNAKLGFFVVDVYERDHVAHFVRSYGATPANGRSFRPAAVHSRLRLPCPVGIDMRHPWGRSVEIAYQGVVDEFYRKRARNDYALAGLWEIGVRALRVPIGDLLDDEVRRRMEVLTALGHEFTVFVYGIPDAAAVEMLDRHRHLVHALEVIVPVDGRDDALVSLDAIRKQSGATVFLSKLRSSADAKAEGGRYTHFISHGFGEADHDLLVGVIARAPDTVGGAVFRAEAGSNVTARISTAAGWATRVQRRALVHVTLADENPARRADDDLATANRVAETLLGAHAHAGTCEVVLDTFADMDRGYFPRNGLVDRLYNPRLAGKVFASLQRLLVEVGPFIGVAERSVVGFGKVVLAENQGGRLWLLLPEDGGSIDAVGFDDAVGLPRVVDLASGSEWACSWRENGERTLQFDAPMSGQLAAPLVVFGSAPEAAVHAYPGE
jgi:3',5'-cyclic AMP phosphodiesterase CpdA